MNWSDRLGDDSTTARPTRRQLLGTAGIALTALSGCISIGAADRRTTDVQYDVSDVESVSLAGGDGETTVESWGGTAVRIQATKYAVGETDLDDVTVARDVSDGHLSVAAKRDDGVTIGTAGGGLESLTVKVPDGVAVTGVTIDDGDATVDGVAGDLSLSIDDGTAEIGAFEGPVRVDGDDGEVTADSVDSVSGRLDDGTLTVTEPTTIGDIEIDDGNLDLAVDGIDDGTTIRADDADVTVRLDSSLALDLDARTDNGQVSVADGVLDTVETDGNETRGRAGEGGPTLDIKVDDGAIELEAL